MTDSFKITVDYSKFVEWADRTVSAVGAMKQTLLEVSRLLENNTNPLVPYKTGKLESSYMEASFGSYPFFEMEVGYSALDGSWDYAYTQHNYYPNKILRGRWFYLEDGISLTEDEAMVMIEKDYLSALGL